MARMQGTRGSVTMDWQMYKIARILQYPIGAAAFFIFIYLYKFGKFPWSKTREL